MHRLEITGATPEELYVNSLNMLSMLVRGSAAITVPAEPANDTPSENAGSGAAAPGESSDSGGASTAAVEAFGELLSQHKKRGRRGSKNTEPKILNDEIPDLAAKTIEHDPREKDGKPPELTLDGDIRPRLRAIQKAHSERIDPATKKPYEMAEVVAYIMRLYGPFGIAKAEQLKPDQYAEFLEASEGFLSGEA